MSAKSLAKMFDNFSSVEFMEFFHKYDTDGNNYIEEKELDRFVDDLFVRRYGTMHSDSEKQKFKEVFLKEYLKDKKIDIQELAAILPHDEGLEVKFRANDKMSSVEFMKIWNRYDVNREGSLSTEQLKGFINDSMKGQKLSSKNIGMLVKKTLDAVDKDRSGEVDLEEMARYLKVEDNFLREFNINPGQKLKQNDFSRIWDNYDQDGKGSIKGAELDALIRDVFAKIQGRSPEMDDIEKWKDIIMMFADADGDGAISKEELNIFFAQGLKEAKKRLSDGERDPAPNYTPTEEPPKDTPKKSSSPENSGSSDKKCVIS
ncbi:calbindin-32 [Nematostella vectensis]|uniref:calbindin-32 n=1 Tax=Nematostella vectensis TaxID=45351 RepID=UPI00138FA547|nr:calbindin-32 [Nematostella vectensis]